MANTAFDANLSALAYNLRRLGSLMNSDEKLERQVAQLVGRFGLFIRCLLLRLVSLLGALVEKSPLTPLLQRGELVQTRFCCSL